MATAPGEKLLTWRRPMRNWTRRTISNLFCAENTSALRKSTKTAATRAALFNSNMQQIVCRLGLFPDPTGGAYMQRSPSSLAVFRGPTSKERGVRERTGGEEERGGEGVSK